MKHDEYKTAAEAVSSKPLTNEEEKLQQALFNECVFNERPIDWRYWLHQLPTLEVGDAARLMSGLDPHVYKDLYNARNQIHEDKYCEQAEKIQRHAASENKESSTPRKWLEWADENGYDVHLAFRFEVESKTHTQLLNAINHAVIDHSKLATRQRLIDVFGSFTGMNLSWFKKLGDTPALKRACKVAGRGGRGHISEPLFCPYEVMLWLVAKNKKRLSRRMSEKTGWRMLKLHFPRVHADHEEYDANVDSAG